MKTILFLLVLTAFVSCKVSKVNCKHQIFLPVTFQTDSNTFYTVNVPFCDTVLVTPKAK